MSNEFAACANNLNAAIKNDSSVPEKPIIMDRHYVNGPTPLPATAVPPSGAADIPRTNINVGSTSWNCNPYFGNFYNYYTSQTYELGDVSHQYSNQKCGAQFSCNYQQPMAPNSVLQCCDPRCQLLSEQSKYPFSQALCSKSHQKAKRARGYYGGLLDIPKPDITSRPPPDYAASAKYGPMVPYPTHMNDLNNKYNSQQMPYNNMQYQTAVKSSKSLFLAETTTYNNADFAKQQCWNKPNLWNPNLSSSYYSSIQQNRGVNHKFPVPLLEQNGMPSTVKHNLLHNHPTLDPRGGLYDPSYIPNYHYMNNRPNHMNGHEHRHMNEECSYGHFPANGHQFQPTYNPHCSMVDNRQDPYYKELVLKSAETAAGKQHTADKSSNLDVRQFLSTWDEGEDDKPPESEAPVIVLECSSLEGDALTKVKELGNSVTTICELGSDGNATVLKVVDNTDNGIVLSKPTSVIQDSSNGRVNNFVEKSTSESSQLNSDGIMTWYSNSRKRDEHSYDLVEMTERLVNSVDKLFTEPEKKIMPKTNGMLPSMGYQMPNPSSLEENYIENGWSSDFNCHKRSNDRPPQEIATNHYANDASKYMGLNGLPSNVEKSSCHFSAMNRATIKPVASSTSAVQDYSTKFKENYKQSSDYYQTETSNSSCQFYNPCYYAGTNMNSCNFSGPAGSSGNDTMAKNNNPVSYVDPSHKNSFGGPDVTQMRADLEKSLNEITSNVNGHNQKGLNAVSENTALSHNSDLPKACGDPGNKILEDGMETAESAMKTTCTEIDVTSHNGVIQKVGEGEESNSTISEVNEDSGSCENSLLSMPSLSPPPTSNQCAKSNIVADSPKTNIRSEEKKENMNISNKGAESAINVPECVGNLNQPLNLAIDKDLTKLNDLETSVSKVSKAIDEKLTKEAEKKDVFKNRSADLNSSKMDDGYYSIETHFDYDNDCHKLSFSGDASSQSKDINDGRTMPLVTQQSCIVSCKPYENRLKEFKNQILISPCHDLNLKSKSAPPSLVNMSDIVFLEKLKPSASAMDLPSCVERPILRQSLGEDEEKSCELNSKSSVPNNINSCGETVISISTAKSEATLPTSLKENCSMPFTGVEAHQEMNPTHRSEDAPVSMESPGGVKSAHITAQKLEPQNDVNDAKEEHVNCTPNASIVSYENEEGHPQRNQSPVLNGCITKKFVSIETTTSKNPTMIDENLDDLPGNNQSIGSCIEVSFTQPNSHLDVDTSFPQNLIKMNGNLHDSLQRCSPVNYSNKALPIEEKQELTHIQAVDHHPVEDLQTSTNSKPLSDSVMMKSIEPPSSVIYSPHSSVHTLQSEQNSMASQGNNAAEYKLVTMNDIDSEKNHRKKFRHKRHKSKKGYICTTAYKNLDQSIDNDKSSEKRSGSDSVIKENTNLLNTSHSPLYPVRSVQDLEMKLSNIRQKLPSDTLLYKCVSRTSSPTQSEYEPLKIEETSGSSACQNENELPQNSYNYNDDVLISVCASNESTSSVIFENFKLGKHSATHKNADLPVKKRKQDLIIYECSKQPMITDHESSHSSINYFADEITCSDKFEISCDQLKKYRRPKRRFSFTEYPEPLSCLSSSNDEIGKEFRKSRSLIDWHEDENSCSDYPSELHSLATHQEKNFNLDSRKPISISDPCISAIYEKESFNFSISLPTSPSSIPQERENLVLQSNHVSNDEFLVNDRNLLFHDQAEENNDSLPDTSYYDYSIPSVAPTPQCDLSKEDRFESDLIESGDDSDSPQHDFRLSDTFVSSPAYNAPSTPNCDFSTNEGVNEDFTKCMSSANEVTLSGCSFSEDPASKAPSPCCMFSDVIIDEIPEPNLYQPFTVLSPASSVAPSPQCDIIDGVILDHQDPDTDIAECDDNNNHHHTDSIDCSEPPSQVLCGVPTLQSLAFEALDGISTAPSTSNPDGSNVLELWVTPEHTEIIIHTKNQPATTDEFVVSDENNCIEYEEMSISSGPAVVESASENVAQSPCTAHADEDDEDQQSQCIIIRNEESAIHMQCTSDSQAVVVHDGSLIEHTDPVVDTTYINGCTIDDEFQFSNNCIEESFIDQKLSCSPSSGTPVENLVYESSPLIEMNEATADESDSQMKIQLPWYKIFNLSDDLNSYNEGLLRELELGPAQIEVRLSSSGSQLWKAVNSRPEFLSSVLKVKRLVLQPAPSVNNDEDNESCVVSNQVKSSVVHPDERLERTVSDQEDSKRTYTVQRRPLRRGSRLNARKKTPRQRDVNGIVGVPKMVIRKTNCREYRSFLRNGDFLLPTVRLNRLKCLDEMALKISTGNNGRTSININNLRAVAPSEINPADNMSSNTDTDKNLKAVTSPGRKASETEDRSAGVIPEGIQHCPAVNQVTESSAVELSNTPRLEGIEVYKKVKDTAVGVGSALFPKPSAERHHCLLCHRTYSSEELYQLHVKSKLHRHLELTQRKTIHAMYRYFTGHLCPRLRPLSLKERKKMKWKPRTANVQHFYHQKTPLQIALHKSVLHHRK